MDKKVGILTFHGVHNYGSCLQAYAMLTTIKNLGCESEIINFRTEKQKDQYAPLTKRKGLKYILKNGYFILNLKKGRKNIDFLKHLLTKIW